MQKLSKIRPMRITVFIALIAVQTLNAGAFTLTQNAPARNAKAELETSAAAKRALAEIGSPDLKRIKDTRARAAVSRSIAAVKAIARNTSEAREAGLAAELDRTVNALKALPHHTAGGGLGGLQPCDEAYDRCIDLCKHGGGDCKACAVFNSLCYTTRLVIKLVEGEL